MSRLSTTGRRGPGLRPFGFNVIGYVTGNLGLGVAARATIDTLERRGERVAAVDVSTLRGPGTVTEYNRLFGPAGQEAPYAFNIFHLNPPEIAGLVQTRPPWLRMADTFNACVPFWELPRLPRAWTPTLSAMDLVLTPSEFVHDTVRRDLPRVPRVRHPQVVRLPATIRPDRPRWGLLPDTVVFVVSFDANSDVERKNPWAAIEAFRRAKAQLPAAQLVVKLMTRGAASSSAQLTRLQALAASVDGLRIIDEEVSYEDVLSLYASSDVVVSTHRSEGLGLVLMEAMSLGKPVIATGWSGNMDFTTTRNSVLLSPHMVPARGFHTQYNRFYVGKDVEWADTDIDEIAEVMRRLGTDASLRRELGDRARADMEARRIEVSAGRFVDESLPLFRELVARGATGGRSNAARRAALASLPAIHLSYRAAARTFAHVRPLIRRGGTVPPSEPSRH